MSTGRHHYVQGFLASAMLLRNHYIQQCATWNISRPSPFCVYRDLRRYFLAVATQYINEITNFVCCSLMLIYVRWFFPITSIYWARKQKAQAPAGRSTEKNRCRFLRSMNRRKPRHSPTRFSNGFVKRRCMLGPPRTRPLKFTIS